MSINLFSDILKTAGNRQGKEAIDWHRQKAKAMSKVNEKEIMTDAKDRYRQSVTPGMLYHFYYDPKHKKTLPYYDRFPLVFPFHFDSDHFLGLNLHYLPPILRAKLMDALTSIEKKAWGGQKKLALSYQVLKNSAKFRYYAPCVKKYLKAHVRSRYVKINHDEWNIALMLPTERFEKASKSKVWKESRKIIRGI